MRITTTFTHVPQIDVERARLIPVPVWVPGVTATTIGPWIFIQRGRTRDRRLIAHELVHVRQWRDQGPFRFLRGYLLAYLANRRSGLGHWDAYAEIPAEQEARALADREVPG